MNCDNILKQRDDYFDGFLNAAETRELEKHLETCGRCAELFRQERQLLAGLRKLPAPEPNPDLVDRLLKEAARHGSRKRAWGLGYAAAGMIAASLLILLTIGLPGHTPSGPAEVTPIMVSVAQPRVIQVVVDSPRELAQANVTISLSSDLQVVGFAESREISWQADLQKGRNVLKLPIVANRSGDGRVVATIAHGHKEKTLTFKLRANADRLSSEPVIARYAV